MKAVVALCLLCVVGGPSFARAQDSSKSGARRPPAAAPIDRVATLYELTGARKDAVARLLDGYLSATRPLQEYLARPNASTDSLRKATILRIKFDSTLRSMLTPAMQHKFDSLQAATGGRPLSGGS